MKGGKKLVGKKEKKIKIKEDVIDELLMIQPYYNINEDEYLLKLELEAYKDGNRYLRSWENSL
jgi:hypothetical protein